VSIRACRSHPAVEAVTECASCAAPLCERCRISLLGRSLCEGCKLSFVAGLATREQRHPGVLLALIVPVVGYATCALMPITSSIGLLLGMKALQEIKAQPHLSGRSLALAAVVISATTLVNFLLAVVLSIFFRPA